MKIFGGSKPPPYDTEMEWSEFLLTTQGRLDGCVLLTRGEAYWVRASDGRVIAKEKLLV